MSSQGIALGRRRAPVQTRPERSKGSSATPEGTRGTGAEVPPTEGDPWQQRRGMTTAWRPSELVKATPPPPAPPQREASCSPAPLPLAPVRPGGPAPPRKGRATWVARPSATLPQRIGALPGHLRRLAFATATHRDIGRRTCTV
eukprot:6212632-Pleurochrysis_carterae.AAC.2